MAELTYRDAVAAGIAQEMARDERVVFLGEDIAAAGGVFKATVGLLDKFGPKRVRDTPISEQAILGAAMGAAMTGLRPIAEIMFSDFLAVCWDIVANEIAKSRYMTNGQVQMPLVIRTANGAGSRFGAQHSQSVENWAMMIPGIKVVAPAFPADVKGLIAAAVRDDDPVLIFEHAQLYNLEGELPEPCEVDIYSARVRRAGCDVTLITYGGSLGKTLAAAEQLASDGIDEFLHHFRGEADIDAAPVAGSVHLHCTDVAGEWTVRLADDTRYAGQWKDGQSTGLGIREKPGVERSEGNFVGE